MRPTLALIVAAFAVGWLAAQEPLDDAGKLQGTWRAIAAEARGKKAPDVNVAKAQITMTFQTDKYVEEVRGEINEQGTYKLRADKTPTQIDIVPATGKDKGKRQVGIYKIDGDTITIAVAPPGRDERPTRFTTDADSMFEVTIFRRVKK